MSRKYKYHRMTPEQFQTALDQLKMGEFRFSRLTGKSYQKVQRWLSGQEPDIPHDVTLLCSLLTLPGAVELAEGVATAMIVKEEDDSV